MDQVVLMLEVVVRQDSTEEQVDLDILMDLEHFLSV